MVDVDNWPVTKVLTSEDIKEGRLALMANMIRNNMLGPLNIVDENKKDIKVELRDSDDGSYHTLTMNIRKNSGMFFLTGKWEKSFVKRKNLRAGQLIGIRPNSDFFTFAVIG